MVNSPIKFQSSLNTTPFKDARKALGDAVPEIELLKR
jgi:hypothetical protein